MSYRPPTSLSRPPKARYKHDCDDCEYVATYRTDNDVVDLYLCKDEDSVHRCTVAMRYGSDGPDCTTSTVKQVLTYPFTSDKYRHARHILVEAVLDISFS